MSEDETTLWPPSPGVVKVSCDTSSGLPLFWTVSEAPLCLTSCLQVQALKAAWGVQVMALPGLWPAPPGGPNPTCPVVPEKLDPESVGSSNNYSNTVFVKALLGQRHTSVIAFSSHVNPMR